MFAQCSKIIYFVKLKSNNILLHFKSIIRRKVKKSHWQKYVNSI